MHGLVWGRCDCRASQAAALPVTIFHCQHPSIAIDQNSILPVPNLWYTTPVASKPYTPRVQGHDRQQECERRLNVSHLPHLSPVRQACSQELSQEVQLLGSFQRLWRAFQHLFGRRSIQRRVKKGGWQLLEKRFLLRDIRHL